MSIHVVEVDGTMQDFCDKLASVSSEFFDSVAMRSGDETTFECKIGQNSAMVFGLNQDTGFRMHVPMYDSSGNSTTYVFGTAANAYPNIIVKTSKAIAIICTDTSKGAPILIIAKDGNGGVAACFAASSTAIINPYGAAGATQITVFGIRGAGAANMQYYFSNDDNTHDSYYIPLFISGGNFVDGVDIGLLRPYPTSPGFVHLINDSAEYVGFCGTTFIVKA